MTKNRRSSKSIVSHRTLILLVAVIAAVSAIITFVSAQTTDQFSVGLIGIGVGLAMGLAGLGAGLGMGSAGAAAVGAISERPEVFGKAMIFIVFIEAIGIYGLLIAFLLIGKM